MLTKTIIALSAVIVLGTASGVMAKQEKTKRDTARPSAFGASLPQHSASTNVVIVGNEVVGRDPDPNVRLQLRRDSYRY